MGGNALRTDFVLCAGVHVLCGVNGAMAVDCCAEVG